MTERELRDELERARREAATWKQRARIAEAQLSAAVGGEASPGMRLFRTLSAIRWKVAPVESTRDRLLRSVLFRLARVTERAVGVQAAQTPIALRAAGAAARNGAVLFVSQAPEVSRRYRCEHQAESLELLGAVAAVAEHGTVDLLEAAERYAAFVLHRVPIGPDVEAFLERARELGRPVLFDTDDLTFEPEAAKYVAALETMPHDERKLYVEGLERYRETLLRCDGVIVSTEPLEQRARDLHNSVVVAPNVASSAMMRWAETVRRPPPSEGASSVTFAYFSGTPTHDRDFGHVADAVVEALDAVPGSRLLTVGPLRLDDRFDRLDDRVIRLPLRRWDEFPEVIAQADVNLAPLEPENLFTECKSCIKWIEAGVLGIPTIASRRSDFIRAVDDGRTGVLADSTHEWRDALVGLAEDAERRREIGRAARTAVLEGHATQSAAPQLYEALASLARPRVANAPLAINWIMLAPVPQNSGGYRNIFRIANWLGKQGHEVRFCVEAVAHLHGLSDREIGAFVEEHFGPLNGEVVVGSWNAPTSDVAIATHWPTAFSVADLGTTAFKAYYIQDFEPEFYEESDPRYAEAARTYSLPLRHICLGRHLADRLTEFAGKPADTIDFALDEPFRLRRDPADRGDRVRVLFFARPSLRRRGYGLGLEALQELKRQRPDADVVFFGSPDNELGDVPFDFTNLGVLDGEGVALAMNDSHVLFALSLTNISNVPYEGMACGCAVLDADIPNVSSMVAADENCLLAKPTPADLGAALVRLVDDGELRERLARRGVADAEVRSWERTASQFEENLQRLCFGRLVASPDDATCAIDAVPPTLAQRSAADAAEAAAAD